MNLDELLARRGPERVRALKDDTRVVLGKKADDVRRASTIDELREALASRGACRPNARITSGTLFFGGARPDNGAGATTRRGRSPRAL